MERRRNLSRLFEHATLAEKKPIVATWVEGMRLAPEDRHANTTYRIPEPVVNGLVAGVRFVADSERLPIVRAHWCYQGARHAEREMVRVGTGAGA